MNRMEMTINQLLSRSVELEKKLFQKFNTEFSAYSARNEASRILSIVSFEHAESLKMLLATGNFTSSIGLLRLQYEAFVRALWVFYSGWLTENIEYLLSANALRGSEYNRGTGCRALLERR